MRIHAGSRRHGVFLGLSSTSILSSRRVFFVLFGFVGLLKKCSLHLTSPTKRNYFRMSQGLQWINVQLFKRHVVVLSLFSVWSSSPTTLVRVGRFCIDTALLDTLRAWISGRLSWDRKRRSPRFTSLLNLLPTRRISEIIWMRSLFIRTCMYLWSPILHLRSGIVQTRLFTGDGLLRERGCKLALLGWDFPRSNLFGPRLLHVPIYGSPVSPTNTVGMTWISGLCCAPRDK